MQNINFDLGEGISNWISLSGYVFHGAIKFVIAREMALLVGRPGVTSLGEGMNQGLMICSDDEVGAFDQESEVKREVDSCSGSTRPGAF